MRAARGVLQVGPRLSIDEICRGDIGQCLGRTCFVSGELTGRVTIEVERSEAMSSVSQRKCEHRFEPDLQCSRSKFLKPVFTSEIRHKNRLSALVRREARSIAELGL